MVSHFSTIGFPVSSQEEVIELANLVCNSGEKVKAKGGTYYLLEMGDGIELWGQVDKTNNIIGLNPHFNGISVFTARLVKKVDDSTETLLDGRIYSEAETGEFTYPFVFDIPDIAANKIKFPEVREIQLSAFAHELSIYENEEEHDEAQDTEPKFAIEFFVPSGLFHEEETEPISTAMLGGRVISSKKIRNSHTNNFFYCARVKTLGGEISIVVDPELVTDEIKEGNIISGSFWLTGRLVKKKFKLFGKG